MLPIVIIVLPIVVLVVAAFLVFMFASVLRDGPPARSQFDNQLRWRTPITRYPKLRSWAAKVSESVTQKHLSQRLTKSTPTRLAEEVLQGTTFAIQQIPYLGIEAGRDACPNRNGGQLGVTVPEVLAIADKIRANPTESNRIHAAAIENIRLLAKNDRVEAEDPTIVCPLLTVNGDCAVCGLRPVHCRTSLHLCGVVPESNAETLEEAARQLGVGVEAGLSQGLDAAGLDGNQYELNSALAVALETADASERWSQDEDVFANCTRYEYSAHAI